MADNVPCAGCKNSIRAKEKPCFNTPQGRSKNGDMVSVSVGCFSDTWEEEGAVSKDLIVYRSAGGMNTPTLLNTVVPRMGASPGAYMPVLRWVKMPSGTGRISSGF